MPTFKTREGLRVQKKSITVLLIKLLGFSDFISESKKHNFTNKQMNPFKEEEWCWKVENVLISFCQKVYLKRGTNAEKSSFVETICVRCDKNFSAFLVYDIGFAFSPFFVTIFWLKLFNSFLTPGNQTSLSLNAYFVGIMM